MTKYCATIIGPNSLPYIDSFNPEYNVDSPRDMIQTYDEINAYTHERLHDVAGGVHKKVLSEVLTNIHTGPSESDQCDECSKNDTFKQSENDITILANGDCIKTDIISQDDKNTENELVTSNLNTIQEKTVIKKGLPDASTPPINANIKQLNKNLNQNKFLNENPFSKFSFSSDRLTKLKEKQSESRNNLYQRTYNASVFVNPGLENNTAWKRASRSGFNQQCCGTNNYDQLKYINKTLSTIYSNLTAAKTLPKCMKLIELVKQDSVISCKLRIRFLKLYLPIESSSSLKLFRYINNILEVDEMNGTSSYDIVESDLDIYYNAK
ncbi:hypothetical protein COBT_001543, partial [Conglomerata obtusa]